MGSRIHGEAVAEDVAVVAVEGALADVQTMAVPHAGLGLPLLSAVVKGELDADDAPLSCELSVSLRLVTAQPRASA